MISLCWQALKRKQTFWLWLFFTSGLALTASSLEVPLCLFKALTGLPCPACGMGHACRAALHGHWADAMQHHPLGLPAAVFLGLAYASSTLDLIRNDDRTLRYLLRPWPRWATAAVLAAVLGVWVWRMAG